MPHSRGRIVMLENVAVYVREKLTLGHQFAPFNLAIRPTFERPRSRMASTISSVDLRHHAIVTEWKGARVCLRCMSIWTPMSERPFT